MVDENGNRNLRDSRFQLIREQGDKGRVIRDGPVGDHVDGRAVGGLVIEEAMDLKDPN